MINCYVAMPMKPSLHPALKEKAMQLAARSIQACPDLNLTFVVDAHPIPAEPGDSTPWSRVARARHHLLNLINLTNYEWIIWVDADLVDYQADLFQWLVHGAITYADKGICAPTVLIEDTATFYDACGFIYKGAEHMDPGNRAYIPGRNINCNPPYYNFDDLTTFDNGVPTSVQMACVGTVYAVHRDIYTSAPIRHADHPAFTDHFSICSRAWEMGRKVVALPNVIAWHADLGSGKYPGESWH